MRKLLITLAVLLALADSALAYGFRNRTVVRQSRATVTVQSAQAPSVTVTQQASPSATLTLTPPAPMNVQIQPSTVIRTRPGIFPNLFGPRTVIISR